MTPLNRRSISALGLAALVAGLQLIYWASVAITIDKHIIEYDGLHWRTTPPGSLFPWPRGSGMLQALSPVSEADQTIYYLMRSNLYLLIFLVLTLAAGLAGYLAGAILLR